MRLQLVVCCQLVQSVFYLYFIYAKRYWDEFNNPFSFTLQLLFIVPMVEPSMASVQLCKEGDEPDYLLLFRYYWIRKSVQCAVLRLFPLILVIRGFFLYAYDSQNVSTTTRWLTNPCAYTTSLKPGWRLWNDACLFSISLWISMLASWLVGKIPSNTIVDCIVQHNTY